MIPRMEVCDPVLCLILAMAASQDSKNKENKGKEKKSKLLGCSWQEVS